MMKVYKHVFYPMEQNTYIVVDENKNGLIIDLGGDFSQIEGIIKDNGINVLGVLFTHGHFDHILGARSALNKDIPLYVSADDGPMLTSERACLATYAGYKYLPVDRYSVLEEGVTNFGDIKVEVIKTPGHTKGSLIFLIDDLMFSGDTLFYLSVGRTDLPGGDSNDMKNSVNRLIALDFDYKVYPGHGEETTLSFEKKYNVYFNRQ